MCYSSLLLFFFTDLATFSVKNPSWGGIFPGHVLVIYVDSAQALASDLQIFLCVTMSLFFFHHLRCQLCRFLRRVVLAGNLAFNLVKKTLPRKLLTYLVISSAVITINQCSRLKPRNHNLSAKFVDFPRYILYITWPISEIVVTVPNNVAFLSRKPSKLSSVYRAIQSRLQDSNLEKI